MSSQWASPDASGGQSCSKGAPYAHVPAPIVTCSNPLTLLVAWVHKNSHAWVHKVPALGSPPYSLTAPAPAASAYAWTPPAQLEGEGDPYLCAEPFALTDLCVGKLCRAHEKRPDTAPAKKMTPPVTSLFISPAPSWFRLAC